VEAGNSTYSYHFLGRKGEKDARAEERAIDASHTPARATRRMKRRKKKKGRENYYNRPGIYWSHGQGQLEQGSS